MGAVLAGVCIEASLGACLSSITTIPTSRTSRSGAVRTRAKSGSASGRSFLILWTVLLLCTLLSGFALGFGVYGGKSTIVAPTDMRQVMKGLSTGMCTGVMVDMDYVSNAYILPATPRVVPGSHTKYTQESRIILNEFDPKYWQFYLLTGSHVTLKTGSDVGVTLYVIKGDKNTKNCVVDRNSCKYIFQEYIFPQATFDMKINNTDEYYFLYHTRASGYLTSDFTLIRTLYGVTEYTDKCSNGGGSCYLEYNTMFSKETVVIVAKDSTQNYTTHNMNSSCQANTLMYLIFFAALPLIIGILGQACLNTYCKQINGTAGGPNENLSQQHLWAANEDNEANPVLRQVVVRSGYRTFEELHEGSRTEPGSRHSAYASAEQEGGTFSAGGRSVVTPPPKYEEVVTTSCQLPSYEEATIQKNNTDEGK
jgi:hypothetical protein